MMSYGAKRLFFACAGPLMFCNGWIYRNFRSPSAGDLRVHLGPGQGKYIRGWVNVDANMFTGECDVWADLRNRLPFRDRSVTAFYSHHVIEHIPNIREHLRDVARCLEPGGVYRLAGPNGDSAIRKFIENDPDWFGDFPDKRRSIGGRLENFIYCRREHLTILTESFLRELMEDEGFINIQKRLPVNDSGYQALFDDCMATEQEHDFDYPRTLVMEGEISG